MFILCLLQMQDSSVIYKGMSEEYACYIVIVTQWPFAIIIIMCGATVLCPCHCIKCYQKGLPWRFNSCVEIAVL